MDIDFLLQNLRQPTVLVPEIFKCHNSYYDAIKYENEYNPKKHEVNNNAIRSDKTVYLPRVDMSTGEPTGEVYASTIPVTRIALAYQQLLTNTANAFLTGGNISLKANPQSEAQQAAYDRILEIWQDEKLDFVNNKIGHALYSETEVAEIWYTKKTNTTPPSVKLKCNVYSPKSGYKLIPIFDEYGDLIAFARSYTTVSNRLTVHHLDVYTEDKLTRYRKEYGYDWILVPFVPLSDEANQVDSIPLIYGKIPVIYYQIDKPIWENAQPTIERQEILKSNHSDQNDYTGSPMLLATGKIKGFSAKGETGKVLEAEEGADLKFVSDTKAPDSVKLEMENNNDDIFKMTMQADFHEFTKMSGQLSGPIMDRMLTAPHTFAKNMQRGVYGLGIQRRLNFLVSAVCNIYPECKGGEGLRIKADYDLFRIGGDEDKVNMLVSAVQGGIMTVSDAVYQNPLVDDPKKTIEELGRNTSIVNIT